MKGARVRVSVELVLGFVGERHGKEAPVKHPVKGARVRVRVKG